MLPLATTKNKEAIRQNWDKPILAEFSRKLQKPLDYFGLPGPDIKDFHDWGEYLGWKTGVEALSKTGTERELQLRKINALEKNVLLDGFSDAWELRRGSLEDIILDGVDISGDPPALLTIEKKNTFRMKYELHNWDFQGGLGYLSEKKGKTLNWNSESGFSYEVEKRIEARRVQAIQRCVELQKDHQFLFLLTLNVRHTLGIELSQYLTGAGRETHSEKHRKILNWYSKRKSVDGTEHYRVKEVVPLFIRQVAHVNSFDCYCYPPVYYEGWKEHLIHFVFMLTPRNTALPAFSKQVEAEVIELPLIEVRSGKFLPAALQHPDCSNQQVWDILNNLGLAAK